MPRFNEGVERLACMMDRLAGWCLVAAMLLVVANVVLRAGLGTPLVGAVELVNLLTAACIGLALAYCALQDGHLAVDFAVGKLSPRRQAALGIFTGLVSLVFWAASAWYLVMFARNMTMIGLVSSTSRIPLYPVVYLLAAGTLGLCLVILLKILESIRKVGA